MTGTRRAVLLCLLAAIGGCADASRSVAPVARGNEQAVAAVRPGGLVNYGDACWDDITVSCYDGTSAGGILSGTDYGSLGGFSPPYTGAPGSAGSGFGGWDANAFTCQQLNALICVHTRGVINPQWIGCPQRIAIDTTDPNNGANELWVLDLTMTRLRYGMQVGKYSGTYASGQVNAAATGELLCVIGWGALTASHPNGPA